MKLALLFILFFAKVSIGQQNNQLPNLLQLIKWTNSDGRSQFDVEVRTLGFKFVNSGKDELATHYTYSRTIISGKRVFTETITYSSYDSIKVFKVDMATSRIDLILNYRPQINKNNFKAEKCPFTDSDNEISFCFTKGKCNIRLIDKRSKTGNNSFSLIIGKSSDD